MSTLIVLAHPEESSFNAHWASVTEDAFKAQNIPVLWSDLYKDSFDPVERREHFDNPLNPQKFDAQQEQRHSYETDNLPNDIAAEIEKIHNSSLVVFHFPLWWFGMPAILKGWMDRVFIYGGMYNSRQRHDHGVCTGKKALFCVTTGSSAEACSYKGIEGNIQHILWPALYPLRYLGFTIFEPIIIHGVHGGRKGKEQEIYQNHLNIRLEVYRLQLNEINSMSTVPYNKDDDFDDMGCLKPEVSEYSPFIQQAKFIR